MAKIEDCPGFETFGADVKAARKAKQLSRSALADMIHCDSRYLANIENEGTLPSLPVVIQLIKICGLPVERYFNPELMREESVERQRVSHKLQLCPEEYLPIPEEYLPIVEGAIDGALRIHEQEKDPACV
jgi:transcriptional regulator with XRE-family HTH domain